MADHLQSATVFRGTSHTIQDELLQCMLEVMKSRVNSELCGANFVAVEADDTTDVSCHAQNVMVFGILTLRVSLLRDFILL